MNNRPNKQAIGFTKHNERREKKGQVRITNPNHPLYNKEKSETMTTLIVRGTLDELGRGKWMRTKKIKIEHPTDKGFFKEVIVLSEVGKRIFKSKKYDFEHRSANSFSRIP